eukprot:TRINITY_DN11632_c0_g1_i2.p1 TRINITY_DN11632_c0_g1~~TRINITY_DN11632_c0_g1_i2.p1  ORF type:complete len:373 (-),score=44.77 TRINITY_DN11632_c0_g1_i2:170-1234(-)
MVGVGFLGAANIARYHALAIQDAHGAELVAVGSRNRSKACIMLMDLGIGDAVTYGKYEEVLQDSEVEAVYINLPFDLHLQWIQHCVTRNKHVLIERPFLKDEQEIQQLIQIMDNSEILFMDATCWLHHPRTTIMKTYIDDTENFGKPAHVNVSCSLTHKEQDQNFTYDINSLTQIQGCFAVDCVEQIVWYCVGAILWAFDYDMPETVQAHPKKDEGQDARSVGVDFVWEDGRTAMLSCRVGDACVDELEVIGSKARIKVSNFIVPEDQKNCDFVVKHGSENLEPLEDDLDTIKVKSKVSQEQIMWEKFCWEMESIRLGEEVSEPWFKISIKTQKICCAIWQSISLGSLSVKVER